MIDIKAISDAFHDKLKRQLGYAHVTHISNQGDHVLFVAGTRDHSHHVTLRVNNGDTTDLLLRYVPVAAKNLADRLKRAEPA